MRLVDAYFRDIPGYTQLFDYDGRTDGQPVYLGRGLSELAEGDEGWVIGYYQFDGSGFISSIITKRGTWTGRAALFA